MSDILSKEEIDALLKICDEEDKYDSVLKKVVDNSSIKIDFDKLKINELELLIEYLKSILDLKIKVRNDLDNYYKRNGIDISQEEIDKEKSEL